MSFIKYVLAITLFAPLFGVEPAKDPRNFRNVMIIHCADEMLPETRVLLRGFERALQEKSCCILVAANTFFNFLEKRAAFAQMSQQADTPMQKALNLFNDITKELNESYLFYGDYTTDKHHQKELAINKVNGKFYNEEARKELEKKDALVNEQVWCDLITYLVPFKSEEWDIYSTNGSYLYLLIPKTHSESLFEPTNTSESSTTECTQREKTIGFKVDHLSKTDLNDPTQVFWDMQKKTTPPIAQQLAYFFVPKEQCAESFSWNVLFSGHGNADNFWGKGRAAELSVQDFTDVLQFFNDIVHTYSFNFFTCFAGGKTWETIFETENAKIYNYLIITNSLSDFTSSASLTGFNIPWKNKKTFLEQTNIESHANAWRIKLQNRNDFAKYFEELVNIDFTQPDLSPVVNKIMPLVGWDEIKNTPKIRLPNTTNTSIIYNWHVSKITDTMTIIAKACGKPIEVSPHATCIFLESNHVSAPVEINIKENTPRVVSVKAGPAIHFVEKITLKEGTLELLCKMFWPLHAAPFKKVVAIKELVCTKPSEKILKLLGLSGTSLTLKNVLVIIEKDDYLTFFVQTENNTSFRLHAMKNEHDKEPTLYGVHAVTEAATATYMAQYDAFYQTTLNTYSEKTLKLLEVLKEQASAAAQKKDEPKETKTPAVPQTQESNEIKA